MSFDQAKMLETIQDQFWNHGYAATSLDDIMKSTGLGKGSLYGAYGSKHDMYLLAFNRFCQWATDYYAERLRGTDEGAFERLRSLIQSGATCGPAPRRGCMLAKTNFEIGGRFEDIDKIIQATFQALENELLQCVRQAQRAGHVNPASDAPTIAITLLALIRGIEGLKKAGASSTSLKLVGEGAMALLQPGPAPKAA